MGGGQGWCRATQGAGVGEQGLRAAIERGAGAEVGDVAETVLLARGRDPFGGVEREAADHAQAEADRRLPSPVFDRG